MRLLNDIMSKGVNFVLARKINTFANVLMEPTGDMILIFV